MDSSPKKEKILIIEANADFAAHVSDELKKHGYSPTIVSDGALGLKAIYDSMPHLILVDIVLPGMTGYEILEKKNAEPLLAKIPVFLLSTQGVPINMQLIPQGSVKEYILDLHADPHEVLKKVNACFGYSTNDIDVPIVQGGKKIVWVEDDKLIGTILAKKLIASGFDLFHAKNGEEALEALKTIMPDAIVLDLLIPGLNGFDILQRVKATPALAKVPVMILSNLNKQSDIDRAKALGANKFVVKAAASLDQIVAEIRAICK
ncbi:MAG: response regulator [Candidatus Pacebacteria bacterium]|nr:response regulator [Candidatus Paceibacterota bacterium]